MAVTDDYAAIVARLRSWGFRVTEWSGCYGRQTGSWPKGRPEGHVNHHYVCSMNPDQGYINNLVASLANNKTVQWFADVHGTAYLIGTGQMSHAGTGNSSVLNLVRQDQPPPGPARASGDISGNPYYAGTECQHPGDSTPWPGPMLDVMVAINAAEFLQWGYTANRAINHFEHTNRKIDMSAGGGASSNWAGEELRRRVATRMTGGTPPIDPPKPPSIKTLTEVGMFITFGPGGARVCGPGYTKNLDGEEYDALMKVPGMQKLDVDQRTWDLIGAACTNGQVADDVGEAVWTKQVGSHVNPGTTIAAQDMLAYVDEHTQP
jgi:hypothetical protein